MRKLVPVILVCAFALCLGAAYGVHAFLIDLVAP